VALTLAKTAIEAAMSNLLKITSLIIVLLGSSSSLYAKSVVIYLIGDSTVANYSDNYDPGKDYYKTRYPVTGWGQVNTKPIGTGNLTIPIFSRKEPRWLPSLFSKP